MFKDRFKGQTMIVTGGTSGIGRAVCVRAALEGANVVVSGRNKERGQSVVDEITAQGGKAIFVQGDVTKKEDVVHLYEEAEKKYGEIHIAINNAGIVGASKVLDEVTDEDWDSVINANLNSMFYCCREAVKYMLKHGKGGAIVNTSSVAGMRGFPSASAYVASKHGVNGLTKAVAVDYATKGIRCNSVNPAGTDTPLTENAAAGIKAKIAELVKQGIDPQAFLKESMTSGKTQTLQKRNASPEEQASTILYFASDEAKHITGSIIASDGGFTVY